MTDEKTNCESCSMPIESGPYCQHCVDTAGKLQSFAERFERMVQWAMGRDSKLTRTEAETKTLDYMTNLPAWKEHPELVKRRSGQEHSS